MNCPVLLDSMDVGRNELYLDVDVPNLRLRVCEIPLSFGMQSIQMPRRPLLDERHRHLHLLLPGDHPAGAADGHRTG